LESPPSGDDFTANSVFKGGSLMATRAQALRLSIKSWARDPVTGSINQSMVRVAYLMICRRFCISDVRHLKPSQVPAATTAFHEMQELMKKGSGLNDEADTSTDA
jgi:hypothetical protein